MIVNLKPYQAMKDSNVEWIGKVPEHWEILPGRNCFCEKQVHNTGMKEDTVLSLSYGHIVVKPQEKLRGLVPESFETYQVVDPGDIICRATDLQNDHTSLRFGIVKDRGIITSAYMCFETKERLNNQYGHLLVHAYDLKKVFYGLGSGLRQNLSWRDFKYLPCAIPPLPEQTAIVKYLDYVDRRIRRLLRAKRKLIALLTEKKQAIIHRAVTRGLDPDVTLKDSGVEWLREVPAHWEVVSWKRLILSLKDFGSNGSFAGLRANVTYLDHPDYARLVRLTDLRQGLRPNEGIYVSEQSYRYLSHSSLHGGEFLIANVGAHAGFVCQMPEIGTLATLGPNMMLAKTVRADLITVPFLIAVGQSPLVQHQLRTLAMNSSAQPKLNKDDVRSVVIPLPPISEQSAILQHITITTSDIDTGITRASHQIDLLNEYRTRLIADVVTGKLDVREAAAALPEVDPLSKNDEADDVQDTETEADLDEIDGIPEEDEA